MTHATHGPEYVQSQAKTAAAALIKKAAVLIEADPPGGLIKKPFTHGKTKLIARFDYPGVLKVIDPTTGEVLAVSPPGRPGELCAAFEPPTPALVRTVTL